MIEPPSIYTILAGMGFGVIGCLAMAALRRVREIDVFGPEPRPETASGALLTEPPPYDYDRLAYCANEYRRAHEAWMAQAVLAGVSPSDPDHPSAAGQYGSALRSTWVRRRQALLMWDEELSRYTNLLRMPKSVTEAGE